MRLSWSCDCSLLSRSHIWRIALDRSSSRLRPALVLILLGLAAWGLAIVMAVRPEGLVFLRLLVGLAGAVFGACALLLAVGLLRGSRRMSVMAASLAIVTVVAGSVLAAILGQVVPDMFDNPRLALPGTAAVLLTVATFLVLLPGYVAFALARPLLEEERGGRSHGPAMLVAVAGVAMAGLGIWSLLFAVTGLPFAVPGTGLSTALSRPLWVVLAALSFWSARGLVRGGTTGWVLGEALALYLLVAWTSAVVAGGVDWLSLFSREDQMRLVGFREPIERGLTALVFFSNLILASFLYYYRDRFTNTPR